MNDSEKLDQIVRLLEEVRDNQKAQLEQRAEALSVQKEHFEVALQQHKRANSIQDRAEALQSKSSQMMRMFPFILVVIIALIAYVTWLILRLGMF